MKKGIYAILIMLLIVFVPGCYYDKAELVYPNGSPGCDTTAVRYSVDVVNILSANCYTCHGGTASAGAGIKLDIYAGIKTKADEGVLIKAITHSPGASPMPKGGTQLPDCDIAKIRTWIRNGAPNN